uniref:Retroviral polymerase SH3-like domain-containing protein n=1 Tax=Lactuca sativa TaxID=4236 RepID=A0A9R1WRZ1_LACSA|nr:hypothetical protein LSAT_V11C900484110 [Lactuca sativa]
MLSINENRSFLAEILGMSLNDGASDSKLKGKYVPGYNKEEKRMLNLYVKARIAIGNSLPFSVYCLVQNGSTAQEMMTTLSFTFEKENSSEDEVKCLMARVVESHADTSHDNIGTLNFSVSNSKLEDLSNPSTPDNSSKDHESHNKIQNLKRNQNRMLKERILALKFVIDVVMALTKSTSALLKKNIARDDNIMTRNDKWIKKAYLVFRQRLLNIYDMIKVSPKRFHKEGWSVSYIWRYWQWSYKGIWIHQMQLCCFQECLICESIIVLTNRQNDIYVLDMFFGDNSLHRCFFSHAQSHLNWLWNKRLSHLNFKNISRIEGNHVVRGIPKMQFEVLYDHKVRQLRIDHGTEFRKFSLKDLNNYLELFNSYNSPTKCYCRISKPGRTMVVEVGLSLSFWAEAVNIASYTQEWSIIVKCHGKTAYELLNGRKPDIFYFHRSKFEAKFDEGVFLGYSSVSKAFRLFNLSRQIVEETIHVTFDEDSFIHDQVDHPSSILNELTYSPSDPFPKLLSVDPIVPNVDQLIRCQPIFEDKLVVPEEVESSNQEVSAYSNTNEISNSRILREHSKSQIIGDDSHSQRIISNFCMFVNFVSMIELKYIFDAMKEVDWIKSMQDELNELERHRV